MNSQQWPEILSRSRTGNVLALSLFVPGRLLYFQGHFPEAPILPGIVQLHWAVELAREAFALGQSAPVAVQVKYRNVIRPEARLDLELRFDPARRRLGFAYREGERPCASGQLNFPAP
ncbi:MAG: hypothetical protein KIT81_14710 [Alphaproteobacteria bacterium]|nr:hypothetical protein [Alphaproteobacteria bacterium]